ncbi:hypothetical protein IscW_ISCW021758 [Ixodes scapularis]|uniref:Uncharacterized protein n=1 Tax=Ixodes scapularis TaxID=6945 RepID=B7Q4Q8_IXOSC|nr:hypothetical protein IscW_ISCW021758 [Ixodes scapularis]|eukprot:XP_002411596.1 hypothetical protein IscW_ISCW021758 [Ixodes scapularis]
MLRGMPGSGGLGGPWDKLMSKFYRHQQQNSGSKENRWESPVTLCFLTARYIARGTHTIMMTSFLEAVSDFEDL